MISLDCESTGLDLHHGARPFFVTIMMDGEESPDFWEWPVDPLTREVQCVESDLDEIQQFIDDADRIVLQNGKYDVSALMLLYQDYGKTFRWDWSKHEDTLIAGHLLASNRPHDLTSMVMDYLEVDIQPFEDALQTVCTKARSMARRDYPDWMIAMEGLACMPSVKGSGGEKKKRDGTPKKGDKDKVWKNDSWLPKLIYRQHELEDERFQCDPSWLTVLRDYGNADSYFTLPLFQRQIQLIRDRGLEKIYRHQMKLPPITVRSLEMGGVPVHRENLLTLRDEYRKEMDVSWDKCEDIARESGYDLVKPTGASPNDSIRSLLFGDKVSNGDRTFRWEKNDRCFGLPHVVNPKGKTDGPSLNDEAMTEYVLTLDPKMPAHQFIVNIRKRNSRATFISYMDAYERFWIRNDRNDVYYIYPSMNQTGTSTLRWSSSNPNMQNVGKGGVDDDDKFSLRHCFGPEEGREWWFIDYKNVELRIPFYKCGQVELIDLFEREKEPPFYGSNHLLNFSVIYPEVWGKELKEVGIAKVGPHCKKKYKDTYYQWVKNGDFAIQYQAGDATADRAFHLRGARAMLKARFAKLDGLNRECVRYAEKFGYIETYPDKSVDPDRGYPLLCTRTEYGGIMPTIPLSYKIQGTAMWITNGSMIRCDEALQSWNRNPKSSNHNYRIVLQTHDELVFDFPRRGDPVREPKRSNLARIVEMKRLMELGGEYIGVPTPVGLEYSVGSWQKGVVLA